MRNEISESGVYGTNAKFFPVFLLDLGCCVVLGVFTILLQMDIIEPNFHGYFANDTSIYYPITPGRVSNAWLVVYGVVLPFFMLLIFAIRDGAFKSPSRFRFFIHQVIIMGLLAICNVFVTNSLKTMVGRHRPDFIARCIPSYAEIVPDPISSYVSSVDVCTGDHKAVLEGHKSFPSGHSSQALFGSVYIAVYLYRRLPSLFGGRVITQGLRITVASIPICAGLVIAASRSIDNRHHPLDIIIGSLIGIACGLVLLTYGKLTFPADESATVYTAVDLADPVS